MKRIAILLMVFAMSAAMQSCVKDIVDKVTGVDGFEADAAWALPAINATAGLDKAITALDNDVKIQTDSTGRLLLNFFGVDSLPPRQLFSLDPITVNEEFSLPAPAIIVFESLGTFSEQINQTIPIALPNSRRIERVLVKDGAINVNVSNSFRHNCKIKITYTGIRKNGISLVDSFDFIYTGVNHTPINRRIDINDYEVDCTRNGTTFNEFEYSIEVQMTKVNGSTTLPTDRIAVDVNIGVNEYARAEGYFGKLTLLQLSEDSKLAFFDKRVEGNVFIKDPKLILKVTNRIGLPITGVITEMYIESPSGARTPVNIDAFKDTFTIDYTTVINQEKVTEYVIDKTNSNIDVVLTQAPSKFVYKVEFIANRSEQVTSNILYDFSTIKVDASFILPFDIRVINYGLEDRQPFDLGNSDSTLVKGLTVEYAELLSKVTNQIPLNAFVQLYFRDSITNTTLDSLFTSPYSIAAAKIDANGNVVAPTVAEFSTLVDDPKYQRVRKANQYLYTVRLRTAEDNAGIQPFVTIYKSANVNMKVAVRAKAKYRTP
ncbi:MAG: hypothetical protein MUC81_09720 [Bacteroidia bacterium]|jgi:hypothetical protein|nr:hypothetical protein [Bacteroidia bacterium]